MATYMTVEVEKKGPEEHQTETYRVSQGSAEQKMIKWTKHTWLVPQDGP